MKKDWFDIIEIDSFTFKDIIQHTKDNVNYVAENDDDYENLDAIIVNIKNALSVTKRDLEGIDKVTLDNYLDDIRHTRGHLTRIVDKAVENVKHHIASLPKDNYDSMSKEELIALLREKQ